MKVLVADQFEQSGLDGLEAAGCVVTYDAALKDDALVAALRESQAEVLIVRSTRVTAAMMDAGDLALVIRAGAGYNTIDVAAASEPGGDGRVCRTLPRDAAGGGTDFRAGRSG